MEIQIANTIEALTESLARGASFVSFAYTAKGTGETSVFTLNFGISYRNAVEHDHAALVAYLPTSPLEEEAKASMLTSLTETLTEGVSSSYTQQGLWETLARGVRLNRESGEVAFYGFVQRKEVLIEGEPKKPVKSKPLTLAKKSIEKACNFKRNRFAQFIITPQNLAAVKVRGEMAELHA